ncbi:MAG: type II toxin-antitoxin system VapC family toxin [Armatimonadetes bacterium]|nr:type II toxin-antitoxin system VapC family toxin [Armatimonadota bacterium]
MFAEASALAEVTATSPSARALRDAYLEAQVVAPRWSNDALHVALATVARCHAIVSWNFRHIVHFHRVRAYNAVNAVMGYSSIAIHSPLEMVGDEDEEENA